jgi:hypothetical protein
VCKLTNLSCPGRGHGLPESVFAWRFGSFASVIAPLACSHRRGEIQLDSRFRKRTGGGFCAESAISDLRCFSWRCVRVSTIGFPKELSDLGCLKQLGVSWPLEGLPPLSNFPDHLLLLSARGSCPKPLRSGYHTIFGYLLAPE